jgi:hypothetical protein
MGETLATTILCSMPTGSAARAGFDTSCVQRKARVLSDLPQSYSERLTQPNPTLNAMEVISGGLGMAIYELFDRVQAISEAFNNWFLLVV